MKVLLNLLSPSGKCFNRLIDLPDNLQPSEGIVLEDVDHEFKVDKVRVKINPAVSFHGVGEDQSKVMLDVSPATTNTKIAYNYQLEEHGWKEYHHNPTACLGHAF